MDWLDYALLTLAAVAAGAINALAGGGTLVTFPTLTALGIPAVAANITNTVALSPGYLGATLAQKALILDQRRRLWFLLPAAALGGLTGGLLLLNTSEKLFRELVPFLILLASLLLAVQEPLRRRLNRGKAPSPAADPPLTPPTGRGTEAPSPNGGGLGRGDADLPLTPPIGRGTEAPSPAGGGLRRGDADPPLTPPIGRGTEAPSPTGGGLGRGEAWAAIPIFFAAIYGGYFGAGLSVIILAALGLTLDDSLTRLNALKQAIAFATNLTAAALFLFSGQVVWSAAAVMAVGALVGGALGGRLAGRIRPATLRAVVVTLGILISIVYFIRG